MKVCNYLDVEPTEERPGVLLRTVIGAQDGAPRFAMRVFEVAPGSSSPAHSHWWEHEVFILSGQGVVRSSQGETELREGVVVYVAPNEEHCFINRGSDALRFVCVIPRVEASEEAAAKRQS